MEFDEYNYLEKTVENPEPHETKDASNGGDDALKSCEKDHARSSKNKSNEKDGDDGHHPSKRSKSGDESRDLARRKERDSFCHRSRSRDGDGDLHRISREHRDRDRVKDRERDKDRGREMGKIKSGVEIENVIEIRRNVIVTMQKKVIGREKERGPDGAEAYRKGIEVIWIKRTERRAMTGSIKKEKERGKQENETKKADVLEQPSDGLSGNWARHRNSDHGF